MIDMEKLTPQSLFLAYALPTMGNCSKKEASQLEIECLENALKNNTKIQTGILKKHFPEAVEHVSINLAHDPHGIFTLDPAGRMGQPINQFAIIAE